MPSTQDVTGRFATSARHSWVTKSDLDGISGAKATAAALPFTGGYTGSGKQAFQSTPFSFKHALTINDTSLKQSGQIV
jgi:hypothetical protein